MKYVTYEYKGPDKFSASRDVLTPWNIWAARMCVGEGGRRCSRDKASAMLWALMRRFMLHPARRHWGTYTFLMRRFSQPINPRWMRGGDLAKKWAGTKYCTERKLNRREKISTMPWWKIPKRIRTAVIDFSNGTLEEPYKILMLDRPRVTNWASLKSLPTKYPHGVNIGGDWFFEDDDLIKGDVIVEGRDE